MHNVQFQHIRRTYKQWSDEDEEVKNVVHNNGGVTIAYVLDGFNSVSFSVAQCSSKDQFNKKIGRNLALHRLTNGNSLRICIPKTYMSCDNPARSFFEDMFSGIV